MKLFRSKKEKLRARAERLGRILALAGAKAMEKDPSIGILAGSPELRAELEEIERLPDDQAKLFLDWLEACIPDEFKHVK